MIGGEQIYRQMLPYCDTAHMTKIDHAYEADAYFPNLDEKEEWKITATSDEQTYFDLEYYFVKYEKSGTVKSSRTYVRLGMRFWSALLTLGRSDLCTENIQKW